MGYRPATLPELLALGKQYPEFQRWFPIIALGSVWRGQGGVRLAPCLSENAGKRGLGLDSFDFVWGAFCCFLAVPKS